MRNRDTRNKGEIQFDWGDWNGESVITRVVTDDTIRDRKRDGNTVTEIVYENDGNDNAGVEIGRTTYKNNEDE